MTITTKKSGSYQSVVGIFTKKLGVYTAVQGAFVKASGSYNGVLNSLKFVGNRTQTASNTVLVTAGAQYAASRFRYKSSPYATSNHRYVFNAFIVQSGASNNEVAIGNDIIYEGVVAVVGGTSYPITVNGSNTFTVPNGSWVKTDRVLFDVPANTVVELRMASFVPVGGFRVNCYNGQATDGYNVNTTTQSARLTSGSFTVPVRGTVIEGPMAIFGEGWEAAGRPPVPLATGDSLGWGLNDWSINIYADGVTGFIGRGMNDAVSSTRYAYGNFCAPGTRFSNLADGAGNFALRKAILQDSGWPFTCIISQMAANTIANSPDVATCIAQANAAWAFLTTLGGRPIIQTTAIPQTLDASNNRFTTLADQIAANTANHVGLNNYIKTVPAPLSGIFDLEPYYADAGQPTKWKLAPQTGTLTADVSSGTTISVLTSSAEAFAPDDFIVVGAGTANWEQRKVYAVTGTYPNQTITINSAITKAHLTGDSIRAQSSDDGTHATTYANVTYGLPGIVAMKNVPGLIV